MYRTPPPAAQVYAVDLAKNVFQVHGFSACGERVLQRRLSRGQFDRFFTGGQALVVMEACASSHHWSRTLQRRGYRTKLVPSVFVARHRHGTKTDGHDADGIYAVHGDRRVRPVPTKSPAQQDLCAQHRLRALLTRQRTALVNQARGLLAERGVVASRGQAGFAALRKAATALPGEVTPALVALIAQIGEQIDTLSAQLTRIDGDLKTTLRGNAVAQRFDGIFGIGVVTATAMAGEFAQGVDRFADARQFSASLGLTPKEHSSGQRRRIGGITHRGNPYLRTLLVQCAQSVVNASARRDDPICQLAQRLLARGVPRNCTIVAVANRLARISYAVLKHDVPYRGSAGLRAA